MRAKSNNILREKKMTSVPHPVYAPDLSPCAFWLFGYPQEQMKDQTITSEDDMEG
jgi:hypothetical protein